MKIYKWLALILALTVLGGVLLFSTVGAEDPDGKKLKPPITNQLPSSR
jgi:hypothetical protein